MPFELQSPGGLWLLALLAPLILLYVLKIRRERLTVASTWLWAAAERDLMARQPFRRLIVQVPLILQVLAVVLLALALSRPAARGGALTGDHVAIVVDASASMSARTTHGETRMAEARAAAKKILRSLAPGSQVIIIEAGREPRITSTLDRDRRRLEAALDHIEARDVEGNLARALALASDRLRELPAGPTGATRLIAITDGNLAQSDTPTTSLLPLDVVQVGTPVENTAIVRTDVRTGVDPATRREQVQVFSLVEHFGSRPRDVFVTLRQRNVNDPLASRRLTLAPGERAPVVLAFEPAPADVGSGLLVELSPGDALAVDDRAYGRVPAGRQLKVVLAPAEGNSWVQRALLADPHVELLGVSLGQLSSAAIPRDALVVVDGACPDQLPGLDVLILNPPAGKCQLTSVGKTLKNITVTSWAESDPRLRFLTLDGIDILEARAIETDSPSEVLVRSREGALISDVSVPGRTGTLVAFDVASSNWPLKASFVLFMRNIVELARSHRAHGAIEPARTGEALRLRVPSDVERVTVLGPSGTPSDALARGGLVILPDSTRAGFYHVSWGGQRSGSVLLAANLTSSAESDLRKPSLPASSQTRRAASTAELDAFTHYGWLLALLGLALLAFDVWWLTRHRRPGLKLEASRPRLPERPSAWLSEARHRAPR
ncbi:MAG TPA: VWA domain-containing protein [Polyangiaceae bacterium]|nr:VWA domain-containing protein [Polyangiaceae bacterium]